MNINELIGQRIKQAREEKHLLQKDIYESLDIKKSTYSDIETGSVAITVDTVFKIAKELGVSPNILLGIKDSLVQNNENSNNILISQNNQGHITIELSKDLLDSIGKR
jgi:transcriptional regulator with XRE-family HTH domain